VLIQLTELGTNWMPPTYWIHTDCSVINTHILDCCITHIHTYMYPYIRQYLFIIMYYTRWSIKRVSQFSCVHTRLLYINLIHCTVLGYHTCMFHTGVSIFFPSDVAYHGA
jgi:hypothetical protein